MTTQILADCKGFNKADCKIFLADNEDMDIKTEFSKRLRVALQDKWPLSSKHNTGYKQSDWAKNLGVSGATLSEWLTAKKMPGLEKLIEICLILDVCIEWLGTGRGPKQPICDDHRTIFTQAEKEMMRKISDLVCR